MNIINNFAHKLHSLGTKTYRMFNNTPRHIKHGLSKEDIDEMLKTPMPDNVVTLEDLCDIPGPELCGNLNSNKVLLLLDDQDSVFYLYDMDFDKIKKEYGYDVEAEYMVVKCKGQYAAYTASRYLFANQYDIVIAILDLTVGKILKLETNELILFDGADVALEIIHEYPKCKLAFCTAHIMEDTNPAISGIVNKFNTATGCNLLDYTFSKNSNRAKYIYNLISDADNDEFKYYGCCDEC